MSLFARAPNILAGYLIAILVAGIVILAPIWLTNPIGVWLAPMLGIVVAFTAVLSVLPAVLVIEYAERAAVRRPGFYVLWGLAAAAIGIAIIELFFVAGGAGFGGGPTFWIAVLTIAVAGCVAGATYWAIAGRHAGLKPQEP